MRIVLTLLIILLALTSNGQSAIDSLKKRLKENTLQDTARVLILNEICQLYNNGDPDAVLKTARESLKLARKLNYHKGIVLSLKYIGAAYYYKGQFEEAAKFHTDAVHYARQYSSLKPQLANALINLGNSQTVQGDYIQALDNYLQALKINEEINNHEETAKTLANIGSLYNYLGDNDNSLKYYLKAYSITDKFNVLPWVKSGIINNIATFYSKKKNYTECLKYLQIALQLNKSLNSEIEVFRTLGNIGACYLSMNKIKEATPYFEKVLQSSENVPDEDLKALTFGNMSNFYLKKGRIDKSIYYAREMHRLALKLNSEFYIGLSYLSLADAYAGNKQYKEAFDYERNAFHFYDSLKGIELNDKIAAIQKSYELNKKESKINQMDQQAQIKELELNQERTFKYILLAGLLIIVALAYVGYRVKTKHNNELRDRYIKIKQQKDVIESINNDLRSQALRAQMNPHFIFNALNSIQYLILKNNTTAAFHYLSQFSELLRNVLDNSDKQWISICDEIKTLELYLGLESLRFNGEFNYNIRSVISPAYQHDLIPSMVIQTFVENAIIHGLRNRTGEKKLEVVFSKENEVISCKIEDNGIGIRAAKELKLKQMGFTESKGMKLVEQRLKVLNNLTQRDFSMDVIDLFYEEQPAGTKIILNFTNA